MSTDARFAFSRLLFTVSIFIWFWIVKLFLSQIVSRKKCTDFFYKFCLHSFLVVENEDKKKLENVKTKRKTWKHHNINANLIFSSRSYKIILCSSHQKKAIFLPSSNFVVLEYIKLYKLAKNFTMVAVWICFVQIYKLRNATQLSEFSFHVVHICNRIFSSVAA